MIWLVNLTVPLIFYMAYMDVIEKSNQNRNES